MTPPILNGVYHISDICSGPRALTNSKSIGSAVYEPQSARNQLFCRQKQVQMLFLDLLRFISGHQILILPKTGPCEACAHTTHPQNQQNGPKLLSRAQIRPICSHWLANLFSKRSTYLILCIFCSKRDNLGCFGVNCCRKIKPEAKTSETEKLTKSISRKINLFRGKSNF